MLSQFSLSLYRHQMKRILILITTLLIAIITMAYLYFSGLSTGKKNRDVALYAASSSSSVVFAFQNDKSILDILSSQNSFEEIISEEKVAQLKSLNHFLVENPVIARFLEKQNIYIGLIPNNEKAIDFLYCTQINPNWDSSQLVAALRSTKIKTATVKGLTQLTLSDGSIFYLNLKHNVLLLSSNREVAKNEWRSKTDKNNKFAEHILSTTKLTKNSLSEIYINYNNLPDLLKAILPGKLNGELAILNRQDVFSTLTYNYSTNNILFNGTTEIADPKDYYQLFTGAGGLKVTISNVLPQNTANYTNYTINNYQTWRESLKAWFVKRKESTKTAMVINRVMEKYHLDLEQTFPKYFKNQLVTFQLSTGDKLGAIDLSNGDKLRQLLLDLSIDYTDEIKTFKESDILYTYFGEPFRKFKNPYYIIIDNYMVFANSASSLQSFLFSYRKNSLLVNNTNYVNSIDQLPGTSSITIYLDLKNSKEIIRKTLYLPFYRHFVADKKLGNYSSFICQLSGEKGKLQTNVLLSRKTTAGTADSTKMPVDSLAMLY
jgi:hypothetical protein